MCALKITLKSLKMLNGTCDLRPENTTVMYHFEGLNRRIREH